MHPNSNVEEVVVIGSSGFFSQMIWCGMHACMHALWRLVVLPMPECAKLESLNGKREMRSRSVVGIAVRTTKCMQSSRFGVFICC